MGETVLMPTAEDQRQETQKKIIQENQKFKRIPPEDSNIVLAIRRQVKINQEIPEPSNIGRIGEGFIINQNPPLIEMNLSPEANLAIKISPQSSIGRDNIDDSKEKQFEFLVKQNIKYISGDVPVSFSGIDLENISDEAARNLVNQIDRLITEQNESNLKFSIAEICALYQLRLRLDVNTRNLSAFAPDIEMPAQLANKKLGEPFGEMIKFEIKTDPYQHVGITKDGQDILLSNGIWFSFHTDETGKTRVFDAIYENKDKTLSEPGVPRQAVALLVMQSEGVFKYIVGVEYSPATGAYELVAVGGGFKPEQGEEGIKKRISKTIQAEASEEQGLKVDEVEMLTNKPILNAPDFYAQETYPALAIISSVGERDAKNADEVTELGMVSLSVEDLDALILNGTIKDPSIIAARALIVAKKISH